MRTPLRAAYRLAITGGLGLAVLAASAAAGPRRRA